MNSVNGYGQNVAFPQAVRNIIDEHIGSIRTARARGLEGLNGRMVAQLQHVFDTDSTTRREFIAWAEANRDAVDTMCELHRMYYIALACDEWSRTVTPACLRGNVANEHGQLKQKGVYDASSVYAHSTIHRAFASFLDGKIPSDHPKELVAWHAAGLCSDQDLLPLAGSDPAIFQVFQSRLVEGYKKPLSQEGGPAFVQLLRKTVGVNERQAHLMIRDPQYVKTLIAAMDPHVYLHATEASLVLSILSDRDERFTYSSPLDNPEVFNLCWEWIFRKHDEVISLDQLKAIRDMSPEGETQKRLTTAINAKEKRIRDGERERRGWAAPQRTDTTPAPAQVEHPRMLACLRALEKVLNFIPNHI